MLCEPRGEILQGEARLALAIAGSVVTHDKRQKHLALAYVANYPDSERSDEVHAKVLPRVMMLHLGWHNCLFHEAWNPEYYSIEFAGIDPELQETFADWAQIVAKMGRDFPIPYSINFEPGPYFDPSGKFIKSEPGAGLTCATFVLALFADFQLALIDVESWPINRDSDFLWLRNILHKLRRFITPRHFLEQVRRRHSLKRFRPEEVFATAGLFQGSPLTFLEIEPLGKEYLKEIVP